MNPVSVKNFAIQRYKNGLMTAETDQLAVEEPLEIRLTFGPLAARQSKNLSITMRTPGHDVDLALGFLYTEGMVRHNDEIEDVQSLAYDPNVIIVHLKDSVAIDFQRLERHFYTSSSCGVCGKTSIDAVRSTVVCVPTRPIFDLNPEIIQNLPSRLRQAQQVFEATGGLHASALFDPEGHLLALREDVGRHNALDKLIGHYFQQSALPLDQHILLLSGRASFELIQKAAMAGIQVVCAVGAPSSLAVETARSFGMRLVGFLKEGRFNVY